MENKEIRSIFGQNEWVQRVQDYQFGKKSSLGNVEIFEIFLMMGMEAMDTWDGFRISS